MIDRFFFCTPRYVFSTDWRSMDSRGPRTPQSDTRRRKSARLPRFFLMTRITFLIYARIDSAKLWVIRKKYLNTLLVTFYYRRCQNSITHVKNNIIKGIYCKLHNWIFFHTFFLYRSNCFSILFFFDTRDILLAIKTLRIVYSYKTFILLLCN